MLQAAGIDAEVTVSGVDESTVDSPDPAALSLTLARMKARVVAARVSRHNGGNDGGGNDGGAGAGRLVLGCDSVLALDGRILGKPADAAEAVRRWREMRGRHGVLHTGHCLIATDTGASAEDVAATTVYFADVNDTEIEAYVASGEPLQVAGAFTIDGLGGPFVERVEGDPGTVIGLSLPLLRHLLRRLDIEIIELWRRPRSRR
jgi:septum formation protein